MTLTAAALLARFPQLWRFLRLAEEDALEGYCAIHEKRDGAGFATSQAEARAIKLVELAPLKKVIAVTAAFIDTLEEHEQRVLVAVWRYGDFGWYHVVRGTPYTWEECICLWRAMVAKLEVHLRAAGVPLLELRTGNVGLPLSMDSGRAIT